MSDEEEIILYTEFNGMLHEDILQEPNLTFKVIGFENEHPIMQIGDEIYEGEYEDANGTNVIFEEETIPTPRDEVFSKETPKRVQYLTKTNKILKMNRIFITEKNCAGASTSNEPTKFVDTYQDALNKLNNCYVNKGIETSGNSRKETTQKKL